MINPNNPLGVVQSARGPRGRSSRIAREHECFLVFDEIYQHLAFDRVEGGAARRHHRRRARHLDEGHEQGHPVAGQPLRLDRGLQRRARRELPRLRAHDRRHRRCSRCARRRCRRSSSRRSRPTPSSGASSRTRLDNTARAPSAALELFAGCAVHPADRCRTASSTSRATVDTERFPNTRKLRSQTKEVRLYLDDARGARTQLRRDKLFAYELMGAEGVCVVPLSGSRARSTASA